MGSINKENSRGILTFKDYDTYCTNGILRQGHKYLQSSWNKLYIILPFSYLLN